MVPGERLGSEMVMHALIFIGTPINTKGFRDTVGDGLDVATGLY